MNHSARGTRTPSTWAISGIAALAAGVMLSACGSTDSSGTAPAAVDSASTAVAQTGAPAPAGGAGGTSGNGGGGQGRMPGTSGTVAEVNDGSIEVQSTDSQTTVNFDGKTTFTVAKAGTLKSVVAGACVTVIAATADQAGGTSGAAASPSAGATPDLSVPTEVTAGSVHISEAVDGACAAGAFGGGFGGGNRGGGFPGGADQSRAMPTGAVPTEGMPTGAVPTGAAPGGGYPGGGFAGFVRPVTGTVDTVSGSTFTVTVQENGSTTESTVTVDADTTYTATVAANSSALKVGQCATAMGAADESGAVTASSIALSTATDQGCSTRRAGRPGGFGGGSGQAPGAGSGGTGTTNG